MSKSKSFSARAFSAVALFFGFYILALGIAGGLVVLPILLYSATGVVVGRLALFCWLAAAAVLWSLLPRLDRFAPPFPRLSEGEEPKLFAQIEDVARLTEQAMPVEVYLLPDFNAWVAERGGLMGLGGRRVMGIGLPLLYSLSVSEFKSVIAHEFGHYHAGDTRLGPWVYATRAAIGRTLSGLGDSVIQMPFRWYAELFLRVSQSVSRQQEFTADRLAAETIGAAPAVSALQKAHSLGPAFGAYWQWDYGPALEAAARPPLIEGFQRFLGNDEIQRMVAGQLEAELAGRETDPYDTHPPMAERIQALADLAPGPDPAGEPSALSLVDGTDALEARLLESVVGGEAARHLETVAWDDIGRARMLPGWREVVQRDAAALAGITPTALPAILADPPAFARQLEGLRGQAVPESAARLVTIRVLGAALGAALGRQGWHVDGTPERRQITLLRDGEAIEPFGVLVALAEGALGADDWRARCDRLGIGEIDLGAVEAP